ncbi:MAG: NIPSNAP family protein [Deltaproteobacteria bacterium]|jgi:hypothetical protein|nr:NIPSNAP family protein [Deltaproteobacteria bacterium]
MLLQIRIYTINRGALELFSQEWTEKIKPLREKLGFTIPAAWANHATNQFIWIMQLEDDRDWERLDSAYHGSEDRQAMDPDPARNIARMEHYFIERVL